MSFLHIFLWSCIGSILCTNQAIFAVRKFNKEVKPEVKFWYEKMPNNINAFDIVFARHYANKFTGDFNSDLQYYKEDLKKFQTFYDRTIPTDYDELKVARKNFMQYISHAYKQKKLHTNALKNVLYLYNNDIVRSFDKKRLKERKKRTRKTLHSLPRTQRFDFFKRQSTTELQDPILATILLHNVTNHRIKNIKAFNKNLEILKTLR